MLWAILSGEYPPAPGGVSDYTRLIANALVRAGDEVHVWAPECGLPELDDDGIHVHRTKGFDPAGLWDVQRGIARLPRSSRLLVQYVPHAFGLKGLNVPFCLWLASQRARPIDVLFHEVAYHWENAVLGVGQRGMAALAGHAAARVFVSCAAMERPLAQLGIKNTAWLPIASTMPETVDTNSVRELRGRLGGNNNRMIVGHFGAHSDEVAALTIPVLKAALRRADCTCVLLGRGGAQLAQKASLSPEERTRVIVPGAMGSEDLARHLAACDVVVQPYPDGITVRRTTLLAALALGVPVVSNEGPLSEPLWRESAAVALAPSAAGCISELERLLREPEARKNVGQAGRATYARYFAIEHAVARLRSGVD